MWFYPSKDVKTAAGGNSGGKEANIDFDPVEWVRNSNDYPGLSDAGRKEENSGKTDEFTIVYGEDGSSSETSAAVISEKPAVNVEAAKASGAPEEQVKPAAAAHVVKQSARKTVPLRFLSLFKRESTGYRLDHLKADQELRRLRKSFQQKE